MKFSKLSRVFEFAGKNNFYYIFRHSLLNQSFFMDEREYEIFKKDLKERKNNKNIKILKEKHILVNDRYDENKFIEFIKKKNNLNKFSLEIIYLIFNTECNLRCKYCYVEKSKDKKMKSQSMNNATFQDTIACLNNLITDIKKQNPQKNKLNFIFYGSEPLMSKNLFKKSLNEISKICQRENISPEFNITTNGTLIDDEVIKYFKGFNVKISISLDGPQKINDEMRIDSFGKGTYKTIIQGINKLKKQKIPFGISCTISNHNVHLLDQCSNLFKKLGAESIGFNILLNAKDYKIPQVSLNKLNDSLFVASRNLDKENIYEDRVQRKIRAFNGIPRFKDCGGVGNQLVFFPNGDIGICEAYLCNRKNVVGNVKDLKLQDLYQNKIINKWTKRYPLNMEECISCPVLGMCGGGCPFNSDVRLGSINKLDKPFCIHTFKIFEKLMKEAIKKKTGEKDLFMRDISFMFYDKKYLNR